MKSRFAGLVTVGVALCVVAAVALGGSKGDPLISQSYIEGTYSEELTETLEKKASQATQEIYDAAENKLEQAAKADLAAAEKITPQDSGSYTPVELASGERVELAAGDSLVFFSGKAKVEQGTLADVTNGKTILGGGTLTVGHRYIATAETAIQQTSKGSLGLEGLGQVKKDTGSEPLPFADVKEGDWYYEAISYVYEQGYFSGMGGGLFSPNTSMSRAMLATVLYRLSGESYTGSANFNDVPEDIWYTTAVAWANEKGIVKGMGGNCFAPDAFVTREQMVTMLYRYQEYRAGNVSARGNLSTFPDGAEVSSWAEEGVAWAVGKKLLTGRNTGHLDPGGTATRAEVATILQRFDTMT